MPSNNSLVFKIDMDDDIIAVNEAWDAFALKNDAPELVGTKVVGRSLWDFVGDQTTRQLYRELLTHVRGGATVRFPFRCDSPGLRRRLEMIVWPTEDTLVGFESHVVTSEPRVEQPMWERHALRSGDLVRVCGWCKRVDVSGQWREIEEAIVQLTLFEQHHPPQMTHGICSPCLERMLATLAHVEQQNPKRG
jgi:hypothetical protein